MATIKSYSDLQQSKKLAEILPLESADMGWNVFVDGTTRILPINDWDLVKDGSGSVEFYHAWSFAALLGVLPVVNFNTPALKIKLNHKYYMELCIDSLTHKYIITNDYDNPVDACVAMIEKLHELKML